MGTAERIPSARSGPDDSAWPAHVGVGGVSAHHARTATAPSIGAALTLLDDWVAAGGREVGDFPYAQVIDVYRTLGRNYVPTDLTVRLREIADRLPDPRSAADHVLAEWLPTTFDQDHGKYDSYAAIPLFERLATGDADPDTMLDNQVVGLVADLVLVEAEALTVNPDARGQLQRTRAALLALTRVEQLAPRASAATMRYGRVNASHRIDDTALAMRARVYASETLEAVVPVARQAVTVAMLPTTPLHDEIMFIRGIQTFELVYRQVVRCLGRAVTALENGDPAVATAEVRDAHLRIAATPALHRVLTTMSREAFASIRAHTDGRSAVQSRSYREIEHMSAVRPPGPADAKSAEVDITSVTVQEAFTRSVEVLGAERMQPVATALLDLDHDWRAMKRTHWGITRKIIGEVQGTGGTAGAAYLEVTSRTPLYPDLQDTAWTTAPERRRSA